MKRTLLLVLIGSACGAVEVEELPEVTVVGETPGVAVAPAVATAAVLEALPGSEFLPLPLRPTDPVLAELDSFLGAMNALREGRPREAALALDQARREGDGHPQLVALQAWALLNGGDAADAARVVQPAAAKGSGAAQYALARALYAAGDRAGAHVWFERCRGRFAGSDGFLPWAPESALAAQAPLAALRDLDRMLLDGPLPLELGLIRARALAMAERSDEAVSQFDQLLHGEAGQDPAVWNETGTVVFRAALEGGADGGPEEFARAARYFRWATDLDPQEARFRFNLACAQDWGGHSGEAEHSYERALELRPGYIEAFENLVLLLQSQGRQEEARAARNQMLRQPLTPEELQRVLD